MPGHLTWPGKHCNDTFCNIKWKWREDMWW